MRGALSNERASSRRLRRDLLRALSEPTSLCACSCGGVGGLVGHVVGKAVCSSPMFTVTSSSQAAGPHLPRNRS
jgi:hypothetical protein